MTTTTSTYRKKYSTVKTKSGDEKFPIHDAAHAHSALDLLGHAKPALSATQKAAVVRKAARYGVHPNPGTQAAAVKSTSSPRSKASR